MLAIASSSCDSSGEIPLALSSARTFDLCFLSRRLYLSRTERCDTLKRGYTKAFKLSACSFVSTQRTKIQFPFYSCLFLFVLEG